MALRQKKVHPLHRFRGVMIVMLCLSLSSCYFFRKRKTGAESGAEASTLGGGLGGRAGGANAAQLEAIRAISSDHPPAGIRPDPDVFVRRLLLQYRSEGSTVARQIGQVESYRLLLGGASEDFSVTPQESYDATSLLAKFKVAEEICRGLVDPNATEHPGWQTILPKPASQSAENISFLAQRFLGIPSSEVSSSVLSSLSDILTAGSQGGEVSNSSYVLVCTGLLLDAESLLL